MSSYNSVNGVPTASDPYLIDTLMRQTFGFQGYFTGDCDAISAGINPQHHWQPAGFPHPVTVIESLAFALGAGEDAECNAGFTNASNYRGPTAASTTAGGTMNAIGMNITTGTGLHTVNDLDVSATRLFTNRMKLGEFDPDATVPWLTQAQARVPAGTWVNSNANNAVTETRGPAGARARGRRQVDRPAEERDEDPQGRLHREAPADHRAGDRELQGARGRLLRQQRQLLPGRLLEHAGRGRDRRTRSASTRGSGTPSRRSTRRRRSTSSAASPARARTPATAAIRSIRRP